MSSSDKEGSAEMTKSLKLDEQGGTCIQSFAHRNLWQKTDSDTGFLVN